MDINTPGLITRGGFGVTYFEPDFPSSGSHEWNFTLEKELFRNIVARASYIGQHATKLEQFQSLNSSPNDYIWYVRTKQALPTGEFAGVARRPFDNQTYGTVDRIAKTGWSNTNAFEFEIERRYADGWGFQWYYTLNNSFSAAGNGWREDFLSPVEAYVDGLVPADDKARNRFLNYMRDTEIPKHRMRWNWLYDLPFGKGKWLGRNSPGFLNALIGGWQLAGTGTMVSTYVSAPAGNWGEQGKFEFYGTKYKVNDCRSGTCYEGYLWYNGYIPAHQINTPNGVQGIPANYKPAHQPILPFPADFDPNSPKYINDPLRNFYGSNTVFLTLANGAQVRTGFNPGFHPLSKVFFLGPMAWGFDASLFKAFRLGESKQVRVNADFFNVLNRPGLPGPNNSTGILSLQNSRSTPRQLQLTLRLTW